MQHQMHMNRQRSHDRIDSLLKVHIEALNGDPNSQRTVAALRNVKSDFHGLVNEIFDELDAISQQEATDESAQRDATDDGA